ncbi:MAG: tryptophan--tRNA ligase [Myxococcota bacterium]|jgi:tryptophanyl-tRNA synthetase|nr:tryptophan--tRNA ligase [Myxococcota bacterium]
MSETPTSKERLFSGVQPTGLVHIGNYLGAFANWIRLQEEHEAIFSVVDLHSLTVHASERPLAERTRELATMILASGVDPARATLFVQSHVPEHCELTWLLNTVTPLGDLHRMTQFKDKARQNKGNINMGLLGYPVLMAADILLYRAKVVPVGEDQLQHLELAREIARQFNGIYGPCFPEPAARLTEARRVMGLDGESKMSKSLNNYIALEEPFAEYWPRLARAVTDPARVRKSDPGEPTKCNVYAYHTFFSDDDTLGWVEQGCRRAEFGCFDCKRRLAEGMERLLAPIRERAAELRARPAAVDEVLAAGAQRCRAIARETMREVRDRMGLVPPYDAW